MLRFPSCLGQNIMLVVVFFLNQFCFLTGLARVITAVGLKSVMSKNVDYWEFPGGPVIRTRCFHCWGWGSIPGQGTEV